MNIEINNQKENLLANDDRIQINEDQFSDESIDISLDSSDIEIISDYHKDVEEFTPNKNDVNLNTVIEINKPI